MGIWTTMMVGYNLKVDKDEVTKAPLKALVSGSCRHYAVQVVYVIHGLYKTYIKTVLQHNAISKKQCH